MGHSALARVETNVYNDIDNCLKESRLSETVAEMLGLRRPGAGLVELAAAIRSGLPIRSLDRVKDLLAISDRELAALLGVNPRTIARTRRGERLSVAVGDRVFRAAGLFARARAVLGGEEAAREWLRTPQIGLGGRVPLELMVTEPGTREIEDLLGRIEYGVPS